MVMDLGVEKSLNLQFAVQWQEGANFSAIYGLLVINVVSVRRAFLLVLGIGCVILLWHSLCLPYIFLERFDYMIQKLLCLHFYASIFTKKNTHTILVWKPSHPHKASLFIRPVISLFSSPEQKVSL